MAAAHRDNSAAPTITVPQRTAAYRWGGAGVASIKTETRLVRSAANSPMKNSSPRQIMGSIWAK